jgi:hypothetical protein
VRLLEWCVNVKATGHDSGHVKSEINCCHSTPMPVVGEKSPLHQQPMLHFAILVQRVAKLEQFDERALLGGHRLLSPDDNTVSALPGWRASVTR